MFNWACLFFGPGEWASALILQTLSVMNSKNLLCVKFSWFIYLILLAN